MTTLAVSINGGITAMRMVQPRTAVIKPGVLCEVSVDGEMQLCLVERVAPDGTLSVRRLPSDREAPRPVARGQAANELPR